jgi:hypothetical protein
MTKTLREKYAAALIAKGEKEVKSKSSKFLTFTRADGGFYFIGKAGSLRFGHSSSTSFPVSQERKDFLLGKDKATILAASCAVLFLLFCGGGEVRAEQTTIYDARGNVVGKANTLPGGRTDYYDSKGSRVESSFKSPGRTDYYNSQGTRTFSTFGSGRK